jgi:hypothetical protein
MNENSELFRIEDRYCPICGNFVKAGSSHQCLEKDLKKIDKEEKSKNEETNRTYADKLNEFDNFYNSDNYYNNDIEEE